MFASFSPYVTAFQLQRRETPGLEFRIEFAYLKDHSRSIENYLKSLKSRSAARIVAYLFLLLVNAPCGVIHTVISQRAEVCVIKK